jgi:hypothetical protein
VPGVSVAAAIIECMFDTLPLDPAAFSDADDAAVVAAIEDWARIEAAAGARRLARDTPTRAATSVTVAPANTNRTASNRCSTTDNATSTNPDLPSPTPPRGHHTQVAEDRPVSSINWHRTSGYT